MRKKQFETLAPEFEGEKAGQADEYAIGAFVRDGILAADFYENKSGRWTAMWRTLLDNTEFCNYDFQKKIWSGEKLDTAGSRHMSLNIYRRASGNGYRTLGDAEKTVKDFVRQTGGYTCAGVWDTLRYEEDRIAEESRAAAEERRSRRIQKKMALAPPLPDDFDSFITDRLFRHDHIMYVSGKKAVCTRCAGETERTGSMKHNAEGTCPSCGRPVTYKHTGRMSEHETRKEVLLIQQWENDVILRYFKCSLYSRAGSRESLHYSESVRTYHNKRIECYDRRYICYADFCGKEFWSDRMVCGRQVSYGRCCLYGGNMQEIAGLLGERAYLPVREMAEEGTVIPWRKILMYPSRGAVFEKLYKAGLKRLAVEHICTGNVKIHDGQKALKKILGITSPMLLYMQNHDSGRKVLEVFQDAKKDSHGLNDREIAELAEAGISAGELKKVSAGSRIIKTLHYLQKAGGYSGLKNTYSHYADYMAMVQAMDYDLEKDTVRYPEDLKAAHDKAVAAFNRQESDKKKREALKKYPGIRKREKELNEKYGYRDGDYMIVAPADAADIIEEGRALHHCVGGDTYLYRHDAGHTFILFLRRTQAPDERYYTIELDPGDGSIVQYYGYNDKKPDKEQVDRVLGKWRRQLRRKESRKKTAV
ncbi:MAG: PcfJ domain-containing protein [Lachnospiraceae bacterium]|nr:PcfJ domain-containing protein [Lachnospiraceae bacterium]